MNIKQLLKAARSREGYETSTALAAALGVSRAAITHWENGDANPTPENAVAIAQIAGEDPTTIVLDVMEEAARTDDLRSVIAEIKRRSRAVAAALLVTLVTMQQCILCKMSRYRENADLLRSPRTA